MQALAKLFTKGASAIGSKVVEYAPKAIGKLTELLGKGASKVAEKAPDIGVKVSEGAGKIAEKLTGEAVETAGREAAEQAGKKVAQETVEQVGEKVAKEAGETVLTQGGKKVAQEATESIGKTILKKIRNFGVGLGVAQVGLSATGNGDLIPNTLEAGKNVAGGMVDATSAITDFISTVTKVVNHVVKGDFGGAINDISEFGQNHPIASAVALGAAGFMGRSTALGKIAMVGAAVLGGNQLLQANAEAAASSDDAALAAIDCTNNMSPIADTEATQPTDSANAELNNAITAYTASQAEPSSSASVQDEASAAMQQDDYSLGA